MLPSKSDPRWHLIATQPDNLHFSSLPTRMLMMKLKMLQLDGSHQDAAAAIDMVYDFFLKNREILVDDIHILFPELASSGVEQK